MDDLSLKVLDPRDVAWIGAILLAAAHVDGEYEGSEMEAIRDLLCEVMALPRLPAPVLESLIAFDFDEFDLSAACERLSLPTHESKHRLLELVVQVVGADQEFHPNEAVFIDDVARHVGLPPEAYADLVTRLEKLPD